MKTKKTKSESQFPHTDPPFPFKDFQKMAGIMKNCCPDGWGAVGCCSPFFTTRRKREGDQGQEAKKERHARKPSPRGEKS